MKTFYFVMMRHSTIIGWFLFASLMMVSLTSCQIFNGEEIENGKFKQSGIRLDLPGEKLDVNILSSKKRVMSPEEHKEELRRQAEEERLKTELEAEKKERLYKIETKEKKRRVLLILSCICYILGIAAVVAGILLEGWKTFGMVAIAMMGLGIFFMTLINMLPIFTIALIVPIGWGVLRLMYVFKHVAFDKKSREKVTT